MKNKYDVWCSILIFCILSGASTLLLFLKKIDGGNYVALITVVLVICCLIAFKKSIVEISVAGTTLKLKEATDEARDVLRELKDVNLESFRMLLGNNRYPNSTFKDNSLVITRIRNFFDILEKINERKLTDDLKSEIKLSVDILIKEQFQAIKSHLKEKKYKLDQYGEYPQPMYISFLIDHVVSDNVDLQVEKLSTVEKVRVEFSIAIENYMELYRLKQKLDR
ncbi:hypothetical protein B9T31_09600 [Acinetobacter sp. ANC 4558]|uniref:hypothetical protein n=1 Tax=Acinetobacter sp. ANC 4558 TaxID=1977876 RepID=UPI000A339810|nr:hypothetical protein [Acinetobacter sp. ANC 4558]OTG85839.1 hypothetical protein B9T31_09600 [Acinetobacter sp. ANC 4558]